MPKAIRSNPFYPLTWAKLLKWNDPLTLLSMLLALCVLPYLLFCAARVFNLLGYPYPLDYGEGPLVAQVAALQTGTSITQLYADPAQPPFLVVNYPPVFLLLAAALAQPLGSPLLAGRLLALLATLGSVVALGMLLHNTGAIHRAPMPTAADEREQNTPHSAFRVPSFAFCLLLLTVPVVREWAALMRVDLLALCLGLWGVVALARLRRAPAAWLLLPGLLFALALYTKPSLLAAPLAGGLWLLCSVWPRHTLRTRLLVALGWGLLAALPLALLQWATSGWFWLHVVWANANQWDATLAGQFWADQLSLRWPLFVAGIIGALVAVVQLRRSIVLGNSRSAFCIPAWLALAYLAGALFAAIGVGKVGAASNYFLELYVALIWLTSYSLSITQQRTRGAEPHAYRILGQWVAALILFLLIISTLRYSPLWSPNHLKLAGLLEPNPPQLAFGRYGLWQEAMREAQVLAAMGQVQAAIAEQVRASGGPLVTDMPGFAAYAGVPSMVQVFEHRQLLQGGYWDQRTLLRSLANGEPPLAVLDYLGNWITPEMIAVLTHRYAQDGSLGPFDLYRPVDPGPLRPLDVQFAELQVTGVRLGQPANSAAQYSPGALLVPTIEWQRTADYAAETTPEVVLQFTDRLGNVLLEHSQPLLYGALPPSDWPAHTTVQHMQPFALPEELLPGNYSLTLVLRMGENALAPGVKLADIAVEYDEGQLFSTGHYVPGALLLGWQQLGGLARVGYPLTPAVTFAWGTLQCFERTCLEQRGTRVVQRPLGELLYLGETRRAATTPLSAPFLAFWQAYGGEQGLGLPLSGEVERNGYMVQWTRYARLERPPAGTEVALGRLGDDSLRLSPGMRYRWPAPNAKR